MNISNNLSNKMIYYLSCEVDGCKCKQFIEGNPFKNVCASCKHFNTHHTEVTIPAPGDLIEMQQANGHIQLQPYVPSGQRQTHYIVPSGPAADEVEYNFHSSERNGVNSKRRKKNSTIQSKVTASKYQTSKQVYVFNPCIDEIIPNAYNNESFMKELVYSGKLEDVLFGHSSEDNKNNLFKAIAVLKNEIFTILGSNLKPTTFNNNSFQKMLSLRLSTAATTAVTVNKDKVIIVMFPKHVTSLRI